MLLQNVALDSKEVQQTLSKRVLINYSNLAWGESVGADRFVSS